LLGEASSTERRLTGVALDWRSRPWRDGWWHAGKL